MMGGVKGGPRRYPLQGKGFWADKVHYSYTNLAPSASQELGKMIANMY